MQMETFTKENGLTIRLTGKEPIHMKMAPSMWANGRMISNTDKDLKPGPTEVNMKEDTKAVKNKARAASFGQRDPNTKALSKTTTSKGKGPTNGQTEGSS
jgi:hypothetical protein